MNQWDIIRAPKFSHVHIVILWQKSQEFKVDKFPSINSTGKLNNHMHKNET